MYRPGFGVVTAVVAVLCLIALFTIFMAPNIPLKAANELRFAHDDFLEEGQYERIDWAPFSSRVLASARASDRPILLVIGSPSCHVARYLDSRTFANYEVADYMNRKFVCSRIDGAVYPEWLNAMLPVSRLDTPFRPDLQIWALNGSGRAFDSILQLTGTEDFSPPAFLARLVTIRREFDSLESSARISPGLLQREDLGQLARQVRRGQMASERESEVAASFALYSAVLRSIGERSRGGFPVKDWVGLTPQVWRYLVMSGDSRTFKRAVTNGVLRSPMTDLLDGGFFHALIYTEGGVIEFDKQTVENADAMLALAEYATVRHDRMSRRMAEETWRYLANSSGGPAGFAQGQKGDEGFRGRSKRYSVTSRRLRETVPAELQSWAAENLGLDTSPNAQVVPSLAGNVELDPRLQEVMDDLRKTAPFSAESVDVGVADISLTCTARAIEVARIWRDRKRVSRALGWLAPLESLWVGGDVMRRIGDKTEGKGYLGDYLAFADAHLQAFLATGRVDYWQSGLTALRRARDLFTDPLTGLWVLNRPDKAMPAPDTSAPELADNLHEACSARVIRLLMSYGRLLGNTAEGREFLWEARDITRSLRLLELGGGPQSAGFFCAALEVYDPKFAVTVGPNARSLAETLVSAVPTRLVAPADGPVRPDLQHLPAGVYVVDGQVRGPFSAPVAAKLLGSFYTSPASHPAVKP